MSRRRRRATARIYIKGCDRNGRGLYYGDFRAYHAVGGRLEALKVPGERRATTSVDAAEELFAVRLAELKRMAADAHHHTIRPAVKAPLRLVEAFQQHLEKRAASGKIAFGTLVNDEKAAKHLHRILGDIPLRDIDAGVLATYVRERTAHGHQKTGRPLSACTLRNELHSLSSLLTRAVFEGDIPKHPMEGWADFPETPRSRRRCLSREEARALLAGGVLEDARVHERWLSDSPAHPVKGRGRGERPVPPPPPHAHTYAATLIATLLYTGGRSREISGLEVADIDFAEGVVRIRPNRFRPLKREWAARAVPMAHALMRRLRAHITQRRLQPEDALFPNAHGLAVSQINGIIRRAAALGKLTGSSLTAHCLRHTFATVMLRTTRKTAEGMHVIHTSYDVAKLLGHRRSDLVETVYAHWNPTMPIEARLDFEPPRRTAATPTKVPNTQTTRRGVANRRAARKAPRSVRRAA